MGCGPLVGKSRPFATEMDAVQGAHRGRRLARPPWLAPLWVISGANASNRPEHVLGYSSGQTRSLLIACVSRHAI